MFRWKLKVDVEDICKAWPPVREIGMRRIWFGTHRVINLFTWATADTNSELIGQYVKVEIVLSSKNSKISLSAPYLMVLEASDTIRSNVNGRLRTDISALVG